MTAVDSTKTHIRWLIRRDLERVIDIESHNDYPWSREEFIEELKKSKNIGMIAEKNEKTIGFMIYELSKDSIRILNFSVDPAYRRKQIGTRMCKQLKDKLSPCRRTKLIFEIRETNLPTQLFFQKQGFVATDVIRNYFDGEDAYVMEYEVQS
jgi:ribosomal-protein-alanine N-acetyltransferase